MQHTRKARQIYTHLYSRLNYHTSSSSLFTFFDRNIKFANIHYAYGTIIILYIYMCVSDVAAITKAYINIVMYIMYICARH